MIRLAEMRTASAMHGTFRSSAVGVPVLMRISTAAKSTSSNSSTSLLDISTKVLNESDILKHDDKSFITHNLFPHPEFGTKECEEVKYEHREPRNVSDTIAFRGVNFFRWCFDMVTGYKKPRNDHDLETGFKGTRWEMTENKWLTRIIFLESIAGVPGMVAAFLRHLHSLRLLKRDRAWIETLLDEAYNERMHLLTFIKLGQPSWFTRFIIYVGQGVFCNAFFLCYLMVPKYCHRFVGYLEEEAVSTYSHLVYELDTKKLPKFDHMRVPPVAIQYWTELDENSTFRDLILRVRADEAKHREVNHTLANLDLTDRNPFAMKIEEVDKPQPENGLKVQRPTGWEKKDLIL